MNVQLSLCIPILVLCAVFVARCNVPDETKATLKDGLGRPVDVDVPVGRVLSLAPSMTELVYAAGAGDKLIAASTADDYPPAVNDLPRFGVNPVNLEAVIALGPDLVLATDQINHPDQVEPLQRMGIPTYFHSFRELEDIPRALRRLGEIFGTADEADRRADSLEILIELLQEKTSRAGHAPRVLLLAGSDPPYAFGRGSYIHDLIARAGGESLTRSIPTPAPLLSEEYILRSRAEVIIGADSLIFTPERLPVLHPRWSLIPAVADRRIYWISPDLLFRPGPRLIEGAYRVAELLHPELMATTAP